MRYKNVDACDLLIEEDPRLIQQGLIDYVIYMREELKISSSTINTRMAPVRKFYDCNDVELKWKKIKSYVGRNRSKNNRKDRPYTHYEIAKMLEKADQRGRLCIYLMFSAGLRVGSLPSIKIRDLERINKYSIFKITVYEGEPEEYITYCSSECAAEVDSYLEYRQRHNERPLKEDAPLIREEFDINDEIRAARPRPLTVQNFKAMIKSIGLRSGVIERRAIIQDGRGLRRPVKGTHGFRKAYQTCAINNGMSPLYAEILMGHHSGGLALESYVRPSDNDLLEGNDKMIGYAGLIDALTINEEHRLKQEVQTLKIDKSKLEQVLERINMLENKILNK